MSTQPATTDELSPANAPRTWSFAADEGATIHITGSRQYLTIEREHAGYEGRRADTLEFVHITPQDRAKGWTPGVHDNTDRRGNIRVLCEEGSDLVDQWTDALDAELGRLLRSQWLTDQPEPLHY